MYIIGGFNEGVSFCCIEAYEASEIIIVGKDRLYDTIEDVFVNIYNCNVKIDLPDDLPF